MKYVQKLLGMTMDLDSSFQRCLVNRALFDPECSSEDYLTTSCCQECALVVLVEDRNVDWLQFFPRYHFPICLAAGLNLNINVLNLQRILEGLLTQQRWGFHSRLRSLFSDVWLALSQQFSARTNYVSAISINFFGSANNPTDRYAWFRTSKYYLPLPVPLSGITTFLPIITAILIPLSKNLVARGGNQRLNTVSSGPIWQWQMGNDSTASVYNNPHGLSSLYYLLFRAWRSRWMPPRKPMAVILLQSTRDRGWPFPGGSEQRDCTSTLGYTQSCLSGWQSTQREAASMIFAAAVLSLVMKFILASNRFGLSRSYTRLPYHEAIEGTENAGGTHGNSSQRRLITDVHYRDDPGAEEGHRASSSVTSPSSDVNAFGLANGHDDPNNNAGDGYQGGPPSGALHISNLRL
ncbi:hypothetical protein ACJ72_06991 [Emergomyces africanus]|uniref:Uncharacterized protein n=1 Tax=Emergomyces africanus TaxID=1955775 RepID=A0A1B7NPG0_9EURO|nr:hypothetical protein ACJ72_06991 [Emergomyces africanus]